MARRGAPLKASIVAIGNELLDGRVRDTNTAEIAGRLSAIGLEVGRAVVVADEGRRIVEALRLACQGASVVVVTGGLGPTRDDLTFEAAARFLGRRLVLRRDVLETIRERFASRGLVMTPNNARQARLPEGAEVLPNPNGTAPGLHAALRGKHLYLLPGVPREMVPMLEEAVIPSLLERFPRLAPAARRVLKVFGLTESGVDMRVAAVPRPAGIRVGFRATFPEIHVVIEGESTSRAGRGRLAAYADLTAAALGAHVFGQGDAEIEGVVGAALRERGLKLAVAESCTGGMIGARLTNVPGSSAWFAGALVPYTERAKTVLLGIPAEDIAERGIVSEEIAISMARAVRERLGTEIGMGVTGFAGPEGGTEAAPRGTVIVGLADQAGESARRLWFQASRGWVRTLATYAGLDLLRRRLLGLPLEPEGVWTPTRRAG